MACTKTSTNAAKAKAPEQSGAFAVAIAFAFLAVIPAGNLLLHLPLPVFRRHPGP
jgi:hypothetical protein